jgi:hypothetical protein
MDVLISISSHKTKNISIWDIFIKSLNFSLGALFKDIIIILRLNRLTVKMCQVLKTSLNLTNSRNTVTNTIYILIAKISYPLTIIIKNMTKLPNNVKPR